MASYNKVLLMGNLTRDPQLKYLPSQTAVAEFGLACNRKFKTAQGEEREEVTFVDVAAFGKTGELINQYFTKGKPIFIEGRLKYDQWEDKQGGGKRSKLTVVVDNFQFIGGRDGGGGGGGAGGGGGGGGHTQSYESEGGGEDQRPAPRQAPARPAAQRPPARPAPAAPAEPPFGEEQQFKDDDIPF
ncbi:MAG TPA: single-stranded DNA-binding protein [Tepidisphaeraceae bacterium]|nr:single-stranded DNA-binding protein [Tepidisphaeraceae bacterium]